MMKNREKSRLRFDGRVILAAITGAILGGVIVAHVGPALRPFYYAEGKPDWAVVWTMRWNALLFFAAVLSFGAAFVAAVYAKRSVDTLLTTEQLKRTEEQVEYFESDAFQVFFNAQVAPGPEGIAKRQEITAARMGEKADRDQMLPLVNYIGWIVNLSDRHLIAEDLFFDRLGPAVVLIYVALKPLLNVMQEKRVLYVSDLRRFALRAYKHMNQDDWSPMVLDHVRFTDDGSDLVAIQRS